MNTNEIRFYLHNLDNLSIEIEHLKEALKEYRELEITGVKAQVITDMPICHSGESRTEQMALTRVSYIEKLVTDIDSKMRLRRAIESVVLYLKPEEKRIFHLRYEYKEPDKPKLGWGDIARKLNYHENHCTKIDCKIVHNIQVNLLDAININSKTA
jgi:hypothetical protein